MQGDETYLCGDMQVGVDVMNVMSASGHVSVRVGMCPFKWACVRVSGHVSVQVGMCPCEWACVCSGEMRGTHARCVGRRGDDEGVGIHVSVRVGIHVSVRVGMCPCE